MQHSKCKFTFRTHYGVNSELRNEGPAEEHLRGSDVMSVAAALLWLDRADLHSARFWLQHEGFLVPWYVGSSSLTRDGTQNLGIGRAES